MRILPGYVFDRGNDTVRFFTEERENFYLSVYPIVWSQELDIWQVVCSNSFDLQLTYELLPDNEVKIYETE